MKWGGRIKGKETEEEMEAVSTTDVKTTHEAEKMHGDILLLHDWREAGHRTDTHMSTHTLI